MLRLNASEGIGGTWIGDSFQRAAEEFRTGGVGSSTVLSKLAELLFVEAVRRYLTTLPDTQTGWLAGLRDAKVGKALALLHTKTAHPWTTDELAHAVGLSRSAFAERFTNLVDMPPMRYLTRWRLQLAAMRLRDSARSLAQIAYDEGVGSINRGAEAWGFSLRDINTAVSQQRHGAQGWISLSERLETEEER